MRRRSLVPAAAALLLAAGCASMSDLGGVLGGPGPLDESTVTAGLKEALSVPLQRGAEDDPAAPDRETAICWAVVRGVSANMKHLERLKAGRPAGWANPGHVLWSLMVFEDWRRRWMA